MENNLKKIYIHITRSLCCTSETIKNLEKNKQNE